MNKLILKISILSCVIGFALDASAKYRGDLNGDDRVDLADMVYLAKGIKAGTTDKSLDVNNSGKVDETDLHKLADIIISGKLTEDSGMNVGIGGWDDSGEDFGGTVKTPAFNTRSSEDTRFYMNSPRSEGNGRYSMEFGISEGNEALCAIFFNVRLPRELKFEDSKIVELENSISSTHKLYGSPKFKKESENDEWSGYVLRFIVMSSDMTSLPVSTGKLGRILYSAEECWSNTVFTNCQVALSNGDGCTYLDEHWGGYDGNFKPIEVLSVWFDQGDMTLTEGDEGQLYANIDPWDATDQSLVWASSDENVATVHTEDGRAAKIKAIKEGDTTITATASNGVEASCNVRVEKRFIDVQGVYLSQDNLSMTEGDTYTITAIIFPEDATDKSISWQSSDENIAIVNANGVEASITALAPGYVEIYAIASNGISTTCVVNVDAKVIEVASVTLDMASLDMTEGDVATLTATVNPSDATDKTLTWASSDDSVATVSATGDVTAIKAGTTTITVSSINGQTATCAVTVTAKIIEVSSVTLDKTSLELTEDDTVTLTATVTPADATDKTLTWTSSDESVATVSATGEVKAIKPGTATITVSSSNGKTATCAVTVAKRIIEVTGIVLSNTELKMTEGDTANLTASVQPADATDKSLTWASSNASVASISENGEVKAIKEGTATITVKAANGISATCKVTVESGIVAVTSVILDKTSLEMTEGDVATLTATVTPADATDKILTWTSSDESVATVSATGEVKALKAGTATITVSSSNGKTATCAVTVAKRIIEVTGIVLSNTELKMTEGDTANLTASVQPADATDKSLTWASSNASVASISENGEVKAIKEGTATITVKAANGISATCKVTVESGIVAVTSVILDKTSLEMTEGDVATLTATVTPADATDKTLTWTSSDESVATVSATGEVKALKAGTATITVSSSNGKTATCAVKVEAKVIEMKAIKLDAEDLSLLIGDKHQFIATIFPAETTYPDVEWWVDDENIASVDQNGLVTMVGEGETTVHVRSVYWNAIEATCRINVADAVEGILADEALCDIYSANGILLRKGAQPSDFDNLNPGIYIIRQGRKTTKLLK